MMPTHLKHPAPTPMTRRKQCCDCQIELVKVGMGKMPTRCRNCARIHLRAYRLAYDAKRPNDRSGRRTAGLTDAGDFSDWAITWGYSNHTLRMGGDLGNGGFRSLPYDRT